MKKNGMIMAEVALALVVTGIIMALSIHMFKSNDVKKTPYLYSVLKNLPVVNLAVMQDCQRDGTCNQGEYLLPSSLKEYCTRLAENFTISGNIDCETTTEGTQNFKLANGIGFNDLLLKDEWQQITKDGVVLNSYIDAKIDINNSNNGTNTLYDDIFPIRIFKNGEVIPLQLTDTATPVAMANDDEEYFAYKVVLNRADTTENTTGRVIETVDARTKAQKDANTAGTIDLPFREKVSFKEAVCISNPDLITRYFGDVESCKDFTLNESCNFSSDSNPYKDDPSAYCTVMPVRPRGSGIFKIFGI